MRETFESQITVGDASPMSTNNCSDGVQQPIYVEVHLFILTVNVCTTTYCPFQSLLVLFFNFTSSLLDASNILDGFVEDFAKGEGRRVCAKEVLEVLDVLWPGTT